MNDWSKILVRSPMVMNYAGMVFDFAKETVTIDKLLSLDVNNKLVIQTPKTSNSYRDISLDPETISILREWRARQKATYLILGFNTSNDSQLIFSNTKNEFLTLSKPRKWLLVIQEKMDKICPNKTFNKITTHGFRHTHCSLLFEAGATIPEVQDRLGHSDIQTTMNIYALVSKIAKEHLTKKVNHHLIMTIHSEIFFLQRK